MKPFLFVARSISLAIRPKEDLIAESLFLFTILLLLFTMISSKEFRTTVLNELGKFKFLSKKTGADISIEVN